MKDYGRIRSRTKPTELEVTNTMVFVASNITNYTETIEDYEMNWFEYDYVAYTKDEYIAENASAIAKLEEELQATKIILGVE